MKILTKTTLMSLVIITVLSLGAWATCSGDVDMGEHYLLNVANPVNAQDVATKAYVDSLAVKLPYLRYTRDYDKEIVTDRKTGLMWQDNSDVADNKKPWLTDIDYALCYEKVNDGADDLSICENNPPKEGTAQFYCFALTLGTYSDWRLPTNDELVDGGIRYYTRYDGGDYTSWLSSSFVGVEYNAWVMDYHDGNVVSSMNPSNKNVSNHVRCVRDGQ